MTALSKMSMRKMLMTQWASWRMWYKMQPLDYIRSVVSESALLAVSSAALSFDSFH